MWLRRMQVQILALGTFFAPGIGGRIKQEGGGYKIHFTPTQPQQTASMDLGSTETTKKPCDLQAAAEIMAGIYRGPQSKWQFWDASAQQGFATVASTAFSSLSKAKAQALLKRKRSCSPSPVEVPKCLRGLLSAQPVVHAPARDATQDVANAVSDDVPAVEKLTVEASTVDSIATHAPMEGSLVCQASTAEEVPLQEVLVDELTSGELKAAAGADLTTSAVNLALAFCLPRAGVDIGWATERANAIAENADCALGAILYIDRCFDPDIRRHEAEVLRASFAMERCLAEMKELQQALERAKERYTQYEVQRDKARASVKGRVQAKNRELRLLARIRL